MRCPWIVLPLVTAFLAVAATRAPASEARRSVIVRAIESQRDAVVNIHGQKMVGGTEEDGGDMRRVNGMGTGVVIDSRGYVVTNFHVVDGVRRIEVTLASGRTTAATLVSHDPRTDLAVIKIECHRGQIHLPDLDAIRRQRDHRQVADIARTDQRHLVPALQDG